jgi:hypothetical protein
LRDLESPRPPRLIKKVSIDIADRYEFDFRRRLRSADRFSETAIFRGVDLVKTPFSSVRALLSRVTRADQRFPRRRGDLDFVRRLAKLRAMLRAMLRGAMLRANARNRGPVPSLAWSRVRIKVLPDQAWECVL